LSSQGIVFPTSEIASSDAAQIEVNEIIVGPITIEKVTIEGFGGNFAYKSGLMKNTQMRLVVEPILDWWVGICIDYFFGSFCVGTNGSWGFGSIDTGWVDLGDVSIAAGSMEFDINRTTFGPFTMTPKPVKPVQIGNEDIRAMNVSRINMKDTEIPTGKPSLGLNLPLPNMIGPTNANVQETTMDDMSTSGILMPNGMAFANITAKNVSMDEARSGNLNVSSSFSKATGWVDLGILGFRLRFNVTSTLRADNLIFQGLSGKWECNSAEVSGFKMDMDMKGITINNLKLNDYSIPVIEVKL
jgi:hypothetical protein